MWIWKSTLKSFSLIEHQHFKPILWWPQTWVPFACKQPRFSLKEQRPGKDQHMFDATSLACTLCTTTGHYWSLLVITGHYWSLLAITGHYWSLLVITGHYWSLLDNTAHYWSLQVINGHYWSLLQEWYGMQNLHNNISSIKVGTVCWTTVPIICPLCCMGT